MKPNKLSRFLSLVLKHDPAQINLELDNYGWANVDHLLKQLADHRKKTTREELEFIVNSPEAQRFIFSDDGLLIRARDGHSISINLGIEASEPPDFLYHQTEERFLKSIQTKGLNSRSRQHVRLSQDLASATKDGMRRQGNSVILFIEAKRMYQEGYEFFLSEKEGWLTEKVPPSYLDRAK